MIKRDLQAKLSQMASKFPVITLTGPRQSGKSTLLKHSFPEYQYVSLEDVDLRTFATEDPRGFIASYPHMVIIDEAQRVPSLFSYIQTHVDKHNQAGTYMLAGSHNFQLMEAIGQSLAGRTAILSLLPFSHQEMSHAGILPQTVDQEIFTGAYPRIYDIDIDPTDFYPNYIQTYVERDVRLVKNIDDLSKFIKFIRLCAARIGQLLNMSSLSNECGISVPTAQSWLSVLEASYIVYLLKPDHNNYAKRLVKSPKLYFYDTGLACSLLEIRSVNQVATHYLRGGLFENLVVNEFIKRSFNEGSQANLTFWRDSAGNEIDLIQSIAGRQYAFEIKSGATYSSEFFRGLERWAALSGAAPEQCAVVYAGENSLTTAKGNLMAWQRM